MMIVFGRITILFIAMKILVSASHGTAADADPQKLDAATEVLIKKSFFLGDLDSQLSKAGDSGRKTRETIRLFLEKRIRGAEPAEVFDRILTEGAHTILESQDAIGEALRQSLRPGDEVPVEHQLVPGLVFSSGPYYGPSVPRFAGYTKQFEELHFRPIWPSSENLEAIDWLEANILHLTPPFMFELARRLSYVRPKDGLRWFLFAGYRLRYDLARCPDRSGWMPAVNYWPNIVRPLTPFIHENPNLIPILFEEAMTLEQQFPIDNPPDWTCIPGRRVSQTILDKTHDWSPPSEWPKLRKNLRETGLASAKELAKQLSLKKQKQSNQ